MKKLSLLLVLGTALAACSQTDNANQSQAADSAGVAATEQSSDPFASTKAAGDTLNVDIIGTSPNQARILLENEHVRVVEYSVKPGEKDVWHTHPPRVSYIVSGGKVKVYSKTGEPTISEVKTGATTWAGHGALHEVENVGDTDIKIILTEVKSVK
jgi:quercetin dioxygenase-like cupin family protein